MIYASTKIVRIPSLNRQKIQIPANFSGLNNLYKILDTVEKESNYSVGQWATEITPWDNLVEHGRSVFGEHWVFFHIANIASGIKSKSETCKGFSELFDRSVSLCRRARYARLRSGTASYWQKLFQQADDLIDKMFAILLITTWGSKKTLEQFASSIDNYLKNLSLEDWQRLYKSVEESVSITQQSNTRVIIFNVKLLPEILDPRTVTLLSIRSNHPKDLYSRYINDINEYDETDLYVLQHWQDVAIELLGEAQISWQSALNIISKSYMKGVVSERYAYQKFIRIVSTDSLPDDIANKIARQPEHYPGFLVAAAEAKCRNIVASKIVKVGEIARRDKWFST
ncbi:hypothetical protein I8748_32465 [Nostoc sp. CENA67]|uniref:Uncharacterized protein n=1 Tax=Amazonocrinis nigriterrae CENA67 TaxID=2794033 RepID=A0A8J7I040_9NOST|nr:hypothetical protein [Amazonocrinis nigriterrae]MBH8566810.1 hypothetical protein [Amazonocrinis nigriterrae CENA67]